ncbi:MAG: peptidoglycan-binding protein [Clostridia bacterium]|nr:peptidoglycan-binding protein [Clostridia bacterium]
MNRIICAILCLALAMPAAVYAEGEAYAEVEAIVEAYVEPDEQYVQPFSRDLAKSDRGDDVAQLQQRLIDLGYLSDVADGVFGNKTQEAVTDFQSIHDELGLTPTGVADADTLKWLMSEHVFYDVLQNGDRGEQVTRLQEALIDYGFLQGEADGIFGNATQAAVSAFQSRLIQLGYSGIGEDGRANDALQSVLYSGIYNPYERDLGVSDTGDDVMILSNRLKRLGYIDISTDTFDDYILNALWDFQELNGLEASAVADEHTFKAMFSPDAVRAERMTRRDLKMGDTGDTVLELQRELMRRGFMSPYTTGEYDSRTISAIERLMEFWPDYDGESAEEISAEAQKALLDGVVPVYIQNVARGDEGSEVERIFRRLTNLFYVTESTIDDIAGPRFEEAVKSFQENNGLEATGIADEATQLIMYSDDCINNGSKFILRVATDEQLVYAYERGEDGRYELIRTMVCSSGAPSTPTPNGIFRQTTRRHSRWHYFKQFYCWAQYVFTISGNILFHSVLYRSRSESAVNYSSIYNLGKPVSHGCVRLSVEDAKWVYENCESQTVIIVHPK